MQVAIFQCQNDKNKIAVTPDLAGGNLPAICKWDLVTQMELNDQSADLYGISAKEVLGEINATGYCAITLKLTIKSSGFEAV